MGRAVRWNPSRLSTWKSLLVWMTSTSSRWNGLIWKKKKVPAICPISWLQRRRKFSSSKWVFRWKMKIISNLKIVRFRCPNCFVTTVTGRTSRSRSRIDIFGISFSRQTSPIIYTRGLFQKNKLNIRFCIYFRFYCTFSELCNVNS